MLRKSERLCQQQLIASLFTAGHRFLCRPFQLVVLTTSLNGPEPAQLLISVSRKRFPRAVDRNRIKRHLREAYRHHKGELYTYLQQHNMQVALAVVYTGKSVTTFNEMNDRIPVALSLIVKQLETLRSKSEG